MYKYAVKSVFITFVARIFWVFASDAVESVKGWMQFWDGLVLTATRFIVPPPPVEPIPEKDWYVQVYEDMADYGAKLGVLGERQKRMMAWLIVLAMSTVALWMLFFYVLAFMRRLSLKLRGVKGVKVFKGEAMRAGSEFRAGKPPKGQVAVLVPGFLTNSHIGYGVRVGNVLAVPRHVLSDMQQVVLEYNGSQGIKRYLVDAAGAVDSKVIGDLCYLVIASQIWSGLGTPVARLAKKIPTSAFHVSCYGLSGLTGGTLLKTGLVGQLTYSGSTKPGMSGSAYFANDQIYGIHSGVMQEMNVGIAASVILGEVEMLFKGEDSGEPDPIIMKDPILKKRVWDDDAVDKSLKQTYADYDKRWNEEAKSGNKVLWADELEASKSSYRDNAAKMREQVLEHAAKLLTGSYVGQTSTAPNVPFTVVQDDSQLLNLAVHVAALEAKLNAATERISSLEAAALATQHQKSVLTGESMRGNILSMKCPTYVEVVKASGTEESVSKVEPEMIAEKPTDPIEETAVGVQKKKTVIPPPVRQSFPCPCGVVCRTQDRIDNHQRECVAARFTKLKDTEDLEGESAQFNDTSKVIKTTPFFEKRSSSQKKKPKPSGKTSSMLGRNTRSLSQEEFQSNMMESQTNIANVLKDLHKVLAGLASATKQN